MNRPELRSCLIFLTLAVPLCYLVLAAGTVGIGGLQLSIAGALLTILAALGAAITHKD